jgi:integrase
MVSLSQKLVDALPLDRDGVTWDNDTPGLGLRVQRGKRTWVVRYRVAGVQRQKSLPGGLKLAKARDQANAIRTAAAVDGVDRVAERRAAAAAKRTAEQDARDRRGRELGRIVEAYLAGPAAKLAPRTVVEIKRYLNEAWKPLHGHDPDQLDRRTVVAELERIARERGPIASNRAKAYLSACLSFGVERGLLERNMLIGIKRLEPEEKRDRVLSEDELRAVWLAADPGKDYGLIVRLLILLGQRRDEVAGMRWSELDLGHGVWRLPGARTKNNRPHEVPLPRQVVELLARRSRPSGRDLLFGTGSGPFGAWTQSKARLDALVNLPAWVLHDIRRSAVTHMAEIGIAPHVIEAIVNHVSGHKAGVAGVYNRAQYSQEKRAALQRWADHVERIAAAGVAGANVVAFSSPSAASKG